METFSLKKHKGPYMETFLIFLIKLGMPKAKIMSLFFFPRKLTPTPQKGVVKSFYEKVVLINSSKFTEKHLCRKLFFNIVAGLQAATILKKDSSTNVLL